MKNPILTLPIVIGKKYISRDGKVISALKAIIGFDHTRCIYVGIPHQMNNDSYSTFLLHAFTDTGMIYQDGCEHPNDLVADYVDTTKENTEHPYAQVLRWIAHGEFIEWHNGIVWRKQDNALTLIEISEKAYRPESYRILVKYININGHHVHEPMRVAPARGDKYYLASITRLSSSLPATATWADDSSDLMWFELGLIHNTQEAAEMHIQALISFTKQNKT